MSCIKTFGTRKEVFNNKALKTTGGLKKCDLILNKRYKIVSKKLHINSQIKFNLRNIQKGGDIIEMIKKIKTNNTGFKRSGIINIPKQVINANMPRLTKKLRCDTDTHTLNLKLLIFRLSEETKYTQGKGIVILYWFNRYLNNNSETAYDNTYKLCSYLFNKISEEKLVEFVNKLNNSESNNSELYNLQKKMIIMQLYDSYFVKIDDDTLIDKIYTNIINSDNIQDRFNNIGNDIITKFDKYIKYTYRESKKNNKYNLFSFNNYISSIHDIFKVFIKTYNPME